jgi:hypothetical protein
VAWLSRHATVAGECVQVEHLDVSLIKEIENMNDQVNHPDHYKPLDSSQNENASAIPGKRRTIPD